MKTVEVKFNVEDDGFFHKEIEYKDDAELAIDAYILLHNNAYGKCSGFYIESYEIVPVPKVKD